MKYKCFGTYIYDEISKSIWRIHTLLHSRNLSLTYTYTQIYALICTHTIAYMYTHSFSHSFHTHTQYIYIYIYHHHIALVARISLTLSRHCSLSFIALGRSSGKHPVSSHSCWMYVRAGRPAFAWPCVGIHKSTSHEFISASPAVSCMSGSSNLNSFRDRGQVAVQLVSCGVLLPGLVQDCTQHSCVIAI